LANKEGGSRKPEKLIPLTEEELRTGVTELPVGIRPRTIEELKEESGTIQGWTIVRPKTKDVQQPRYGPKFKDWVISSERNQAHRLLAGHRRNFVEEDDLYRASNVLRYDHNHGLFVDCNLAYEDLEIQDVGIEWEAYLLRSRILSASNIVQLRVKDMDPKGPAYTSGRIRVGDRLISIDGEDVVGQASSLQIAKVNGPSGTYVVLGFVGSRSLLDWMHGGRQPAPHFARLVRGGDPMADALHRNKYKKEQWPDPDVYQTEGLCGMHRTNLFRYTAIYAVENWYFKNFNLLCVVLSTVCLSLEDPLDNDILNPEYPERRESLRHLSTAFSLVFIAEIFINVVARGLVFGKKSFLQGGVLNQVVGSGRLV
jgi:hypothetical protein